MGNGIIKYLSFWFQCILEVIYPGEEKCLLCGSHIEGSDRLCSGCSGKIRKCENSYYLSKDEVKVECFSSAYYSSIVKELIIRLKYKKDFIAGEILCDYMVHTVKNMNRQFDIVTFVPMTGKDLKSRGFNQSEYLAKGISRQIELPMFKCLNKVRGTKDQIGLDGKGRWENLIDCFKILKKGICKDKKVLLIDDVFTTGATSYYCTKELIENGAAEIVILTAAKSKI